MTVVPTLSARLATYVGSLLVLIGVYTVAYQQGMAIYEGEARTWYQSLEIVVQSMTTTGYGQDAPWETVEMTALVLLIQVTGIAYIVVAIPQFVVPWLGRLVEPTLPDEIEHLTDHVVIVGYTALCDALVDELESTGTPYVILEPDEDRARELHEDGFTVLYGDSEDDESLEAAGLTDALGVVVDATERELVRTVLEIEQKTPTATVLPLVADPSRARYFRYAGVDEVLSPKHRLGKALGDRVRGVLSADIELGSEFGVAEFHVESDAALFDEPVASGRRVESTGATLLGAWVRGDFVTELSEGARVDENTALLVAGAEPELEAVADLTGSTGSRHRTTGDPVIVVGAGLVGRSAYGTLERAGIETTLVDRTDGEQVDVVGDATEEETLLEAGVTDAETLLVATESDDEAILTTLTGRALNPDIEIIVGATTASSVWPLRTAGADYVLALPNVAGRMITLRLFDREVMTLEDELRLLETDASTLVGETVSTARIRDETGCIVVALERGGEVRSDVEEGRFKDDDRLVIAGTERQIERFRDAYAAD
ncbi:potassium channel family protein [Natrialbaceae archaeon A-arb3/5]